MIKKWIMEVAYMIVALLFIGICIFNKPEEAKAVQGEVTDRFDLSENEPELSGDGQGASQGEQGPEVDQPDLPQDTQDSEQTEQNSEEQEKKDEENEEIEGNEGIVTPQPDMPDTPAEDQLPPEGQEEIREETQDDVSVDENREIGEMPGAIEIVNENYTDYDNTEYSWWFRRKEGHVPSGSGEEFSIEPYSSYYIDKNASEEDKVMYLTFDCGYENGFTPSILDTLKEKNVKAMFFVSQHFVESCPEYVKRMKEEGHLVGNHTVRHLSSPELTPEELVPELETVAATMERLTGYQMDPYFRPPMGRYSERTLKVTQDMGYVSLFWSIAYYDYDINDQPGKEYVVDHFDTYHHNGSVVLMHNVSESNAQALGDVIDLLREAGYRLGEIPEFTSVR